MTTKIQQLQSMSIIGNAHDDQNRLDLAHSIIVDSNSDYSDKISALLEIDKTMGVKPTKLNQETIDDYISAST